MTYYIEDRSENGKRFYGTVNADKPKEVVKKYLLYYWHDTKTFNYVRRIKHLCKFADFKVLCTETGKRSYYVIM